MSRPIPLCVPIIMLHELEVIAADDGYEYFDQRSAHDGKFWWCLVIGCKGPIKSDADVKTYFINS